MTAGRGRKGRPAAEAPTIGASATSPEHFPVVGIGASAGGLAAFEAFFSAMPADGHHPAAFVLVQHLAPDHKSILADLVQRYTPMRVFEATDGMTVRPGCTYIIPPNHDLALDNGALHLLEPASPRGLRLPIDFFFRSLAKDQHERAICIVLSGTGSDGALGVRAVKGEGGMVMAQDPGSTEYGGMPRSAIDTGLVDYVLAPSEMPAQLTSYLARAFQRPPPLGPAVQAPRDEDARAEALLLVRAQTGHDFSQYKQSTIVRRIERRMVVSQIERADEYLRYLQRTPAEVAALFRELLIGVTSFFRDSEAFAALEEKAIPRLFAGKAAGSAIRVWVPGCSTGEEAYSVAILLEERIEALQQSYKVQIFATDIDGTAIDRARAGAYPQSIVADVPPQRLARFFAEDQPGGGYRVQKHIRDMLVFSEHDVIKSPPFSRLDLISCRNLFIYLETDLQRKLVSLFHYALNPGGFLFLGTSETVEEGAELFATLDRPARLYQRKEQVRATRHPALGRALSLPTDVGPPHRPVRAPAPGKILARELTERALLRHCAPVGALVDERGEILYLHGRTGQYLELAPGEAGINILKMAREGLRRDLSQALHGSRAHKESVRRPGLRVKTNGDFTSVDVTVRPLDPGPEVAPAVSLFLVTFEPSAQVPVQAPSPPAHSAHEGDSDERHAAADKRIAALQEALRTKEEYLESANEELGHSNEELRSANEELQSLNEELQSTNEELETSKEELQSVNEELITVNAELQQKVSDLSRANNDMKNLLAGTGIGTIFVDHDLRILRFTPDITQVISLIPSDTGRPVGQIVTNLVGYDRLVEDVRAVLSSLVPHQVEVRTREGTWYSLRIRPYRTVDNVIEGAVITFVEITELVRARHTLQESEALRHLAVVVRDARDGITVHDLEGRILAWNPGAERIYGWSEAEARALNVRDLVPEADREQELASLRRLGRAEILEPRRVRRMAKGGRLLEVSLLATALVNAAGEVYAIATTEREVGAGHDGRAS